MSRPAVHTERISKHSFPTAKLHVRRCDAVNYVVSSRSHLFDDQDWFGEPALISLSIPQLGITSHPLATGDSFLVEFRMPGLYTVHLTHNDSARQTVRVDDDSLFPDTESDSRESASIESQAQQRGLIHHLPVRAWQKRPRSNLKRQLEKKFAKKKEGSSGSDTGNVKPGKRGSAPSVANEAVIDRPALGLPVLACSPKTEANPGTDGHSPLPSFRSASPPKTAPTPTLPPKEVILERFTFTGRRSESIETILAKLKSKLEPAADVGPPRLSLAELVQRLAERLAQEAAAGPLEVMVPKGHSNRRLRRARERLESRFNGA